MFLIHFSCYIFSDVILMKTNFALKRKDLCDALFFVFFFFLSKLKSLLIRHCDCCEQPWFLCKFLPTGIWSEWLLFVTLTSPGGLVLVGNKIRGWLEVEVGKWRGEEHGEEGEKHGGWRKRVEHCSSAIRNLLSVWHWRQLFLSF